MKTMIKWPCIPVLILLAAVLFLNCSKDDYVAPKDPPADPKEVAEETPEETPEETLEETPEEMSQEQVDALLATLTFGQASKVTGSLPPVNITSTVNSPFTDTIYMQPGVKIPFQLSHPGSGGVIGWYIAAKNSSFHYDIPAEPTTANDTTSVVLIQFDPGSIDLPYDIPVEIAPYDESGQPIGVIETTLTVEAPHTNGSDIGNCGLLSQIQNANGPYFVFNWIWRGTVTSDPTGKATFVNYPEKVFPAVQNPTGCCDNGADCPAAVVDPVTRQVTWEYKAQVTAETSYSIEHEWFTFFPDGTFIRVTTEIEKNFDPIATDWCNGVAGYTDIRAYTKYSGTHDYVPGNTSISYNATEVKCDDDTVLGVPICGYGSRGGDISVSCHSLIITVDRLGLEFTKEVRVYYNPRSLKGTIFDGGPI